MTLFGFSLPIVLVALFFFGLVALVTGQGLLGFATVRAVQEFGNSQYRKVTKGIAIVGGILVASGFLSYISFIAAAIYAVATVFINLTAK